MENSRKLEDYIKSLIKLIQKEAAGYLVKPYLSVSAGKSYSEAVFCWDNHHMAMRLAYDGRPEYFRYYIDTLLQYQGKDGYVPSLVMAADGPMRTTFHAQPFMLQGLLMYFAESGDKKWVAGRYPCLCKYLEYWEKNHLVQNGLFVWRETWMGGIDNDISSTIFPPGSVITPDLNAWLYLEYCAAARIAGHLDLVSDAKVYRRKALALQEAVNQHLWHEKAQTYCSYNLLSGRLQIGLDNEFRDGDYIGKFAFQSISNFIPLYARLAPAERAIAMIEKYLMDKEHFWSFYGIRSLSRSSDYYNNARIGNPPRFGDPRRMTNSNWQGPVWIPINYFMFHALLHYGYRKPAEELGGKIADLLLASLDYMGSFSENYDAETGRPLLCADFASWNILADRMASEYNTRKWIMDPVFA